MAISKSFELSNKLGQFADLLDSDGQLELAGGGGTDSATVTSIVDEKLLLLEVSDIVGVDGNPGEVLQSNGNGNSSWIDVKLFARQKAFAMSLIFS